MGRIFTPLEASRTLPLVRQVVGDILEKGRALRGLYERGDEGQDEEDRKRALAAELEELFAELEQVGCSFRSPDFSYGLVDFPGIIDGKLVHLCWRDDEERLAFFHEPDAGFAGRRPIPAALLLPQAP